MGYETRDIPADLARDAVQVQDACNLSGVARSFARATERLWILARERGQGTDWVNRHPVSVLFVDKMADLAGITGRDFGHFSPAFDLCAEAGKIGGDGA